MEGSSVRREHKAERVQLLPEQRAPHAKLRDIRAVEAVDAVGAHHAALQRARPRRAHARAVALPRGAVVARHGRARLRATAAALAAASARRHRAATRLEAAAATEGAADARGGEGGGARQPALLRLRRGLGDRAAHPAREVANLDRVDALLVLLVLLILLGRLAAAALAALASAAPVGRVAHLGHAQATVRLGAAAAHGGARAAAAALAVQRFGRRRASLALPARLLVGVRGRWLRHVLKRSFDEIVARPQLEPMHRLLLGLRLGQRQHARLLLRQWSALAATVKMLRGRRRRHRREEARLLGHVTVGGGRWADQPGRSAVCQAG